MECPKPFGRAADRLVGREPGLPGEVGCRLRDGKPQDMRLDRGSRVVGVDPRAGAPGIDEDFSERPHGDGIADGRTEIPAAGPAGRRLREHRAGEGEISGERFEHVLPGADRRGVSYRHRLACRQMPHDVRDDPIDGPIAAADDVAGPHRRQLHAMLGQPLRRKVAATICRREELSGALARAVGIAAAHRVAFVVWPAIVVRFVALVTRD